MGVPSSRAYFVFEISSLFSKKISSLRIEFIRTELSLKNRVYFNKTEFIHKTDFWLNFELQHVYSGGRLDLPNLATELKYFNSMVNSGQGIVSRPV